jgi:hypothetical protein
MAGVGTNRGIAKVKSAVETQQDGSPTATSLTEYSEFKKALAKSPALISGYSKLLKSAGYYRGPVTTKYTPAFQKALDRAEEDRLSISAIRPIGRDEFLNEQITFEGGDGGTGKARTVSQTYIANDTDIESLVTKLYQKLTGYAPTAKELAAAKKDIRRAERENPTVQRYDATGNLVQTGGINEEQFITEKVEQTGAAEKTRAETANQLLLRELGGLQ